MLMRQSILVSGESGAGKIESTKMLMRYIFYMRWTTAAEGRTVEQQLLEDIERYKVGNPRTFHYLNQSHCYELDGIDDVAEYLATRRALDIVGISSNEQDAIFRIVAAILHLGNIEFVKGKEMDSSEPKDDKSKFHLRTAAELFMCDVKALEDSVVVTRDETITKCLDLDSTALSRDVLAKIVYSRLFDWLVDKINSSIGKDPDSKTLIGVLDIYGFESFKTNREGPDHAPRFRASVNFNGEIFEGPSYCTTLRQAEHATAKVALNTLSTRVPSRLLAVRVLDEIGVYKSLLQEFVHRARLTLPVYTTERSGPGHLPIFISIVELTGMSFNGETSRTKKQAEKNAAMAAWSALKQYKQRN